MNKIIGRFKIFIVISHILLLSAVIIGCTAHAHHQVFSLYSKPSGARVVINGDFRAYTPALISLINNNDYDVTLTLDNYEPYTFSIKHKFDYSGWIIKNFFIGGLIGLAIDADTGAFNELATDDPLLIKGKPGINVKLKPVKSP